EEEGRVPRADAVRRRMGRPEGCELPARHRGEGTRGRRADAGNVPARGEDRRAHRLRHGRGRRAPWRQRPGVRAHDPERHGPGRRAAGGHPERRGPAGRGRDHRNPGDGQGGGHHRPARKSRGGHQRNGTAPLRHEGRGRSRGRTVAGRSAARMPSGGWRPGNRAGRRGPGMREEDGVLRFDEAELRGFSRSVGELEWLLLVLVLLYYVAPGSWIQDAAMVVLGMTAFAGFVLAFRYANFYRRDARWKIAVETLVMIAFITWTLLYTGRTESPLLNLYILVLITAGLTL